jgi:hypothetical protein
LIQLTIHDFNGETNIASIEDLETAMSRSNNGENAFEISIQNSEYPYMMVLRKDEISAVHFFPDEMSTGLQSQGSQTRQDESSVAFRQTLDGAEIWISGSSLISWREAKEAIRSFFISGEISETIEWLEL